VTRHGCDRGSSFEGSNTSRGMRTSGRAGLSGSGRAGGAGNAANPRIGSGMQQARDLFGGGTRRGGEKPRGRNGTARVEPSSPKPVDPRGDARSGRWEWTPGGTSMEGRRAGAARAVARRIPGEAIGDDPGRPGALNRSQDHEGRPLELFGAEAARQPEEDLEGQPETVKAGEGAGKPRRPATRRSRRRITRRRRRTPSRTL
jgi:hypothetical protein